MKEPEKALAELDNEVLTEPSTTSDGRNHQAAGSMERWVISMC